MAQLDVLGSDFQYLGHLCGLQLYKCLRCKKFTFLNSSNRTIYSTVYGEAANFCVARHDWTIRPGEQEQVHLPPGNYAWSAIMYESLMERRMHEQSRLLRERRLCSDRIRFAAKQAAQIDADKADLFVDSGMLMFKVESDHDHDPDSRPPGRRNVPRYLQVPAEGRTIWNFPIGNQQIEAPLAA